MRGLTFDERVVAQSLLKRPSLRSMAPERLAGMLRVPTSAARGGIASVVEFAKRQGRGELLHNDAMTVAIGGMSLDKAMARWGSNAAAPVFSSRPRYANAGADDATDEGGDSAPRDTPIIVSGDNRGAVQEQIKEAPPPVIGPGPAPAPPAPTPTPEPSIVSKVPWYVWAGGAVAVALVVMGRKKRGKK